MRDKFDWKVALRTGLGASLAWILDQQLTDWIGWTDQTISGLWAVISSIVILQSSLGGGYLEWYKEFVGILIGSLLGVIATTWLGWEPFHLAMSLFLTVLLMGLLGLQISTRIACLSCAFVIVVWSLNPIGSPWIFTLHRVVDSCLGLAVGLLTSHFLFPSETKRKLQKNKSKIFSLFSSSLKFNNPDILQEAEKLIKEDEQWIRELHAEWTRTQDSKDRWEALHSGEKSLLFLLTTATTLSKEELIPLLAPSLLETTGEAIDQLESAFAKLGKGEEHSAPLLPLISKIKEERLKFREAKSTTSFSFQELENYFIFFYTLEELLLETDQLQKSL